LGTVGLAFLVESLLRGVAAPMFGAVSDRIGRRKLLIAAALATAVVLPSFLLVSGPASLFAWSVAMGLTGAINMPVATALLLDLAPFERRQSVLAVNYTAMSVAYTLGVMPAGYVAEQSYVVLAAISSTGYALVALLYALASRAPPPLERKEAGVLMETVSAFRDRTFLGFAALAFVFPLSMGLVVVASPLFAADAGLGEGYIGLVLGGNSIIVALLAVPLATRIEPLGPFRPLGAAALAVACGIACYALVPGAAAAYLVGTVVFSFGELVFSSAVPAAVARLAPAGRRGAYQGGWTLVASFSMGSALFFSGLLRDSLGWRAAWLVFAAITLAAALLLFILRRRFSERPGER
jgi:MFS family permease